MLFCYLDGSGRIVDLLLDSFSRNKNYLNKSIGQIGERTGRMIV